MYAYVPAPGSLDLGGLDLSEHELRSLIKVDTNAWRDEVSLIEAHYDEIGDRLPGEMRHQLAQLTERLSA